MDLDRANIESELALRGVALGRPLTVLAITASTNDDAKRAAREGAPAGAAFIADTQTAGRGRLGRVWHSPSGNNLYASFVIRTEFDRGTPLITLAAGLAVADAIAPLLPERNVALKWPNDVLVDDRKLAGVLCEAQLGERGADWIVIGIGVNVRSREFPSEIADRATSLALAGATSLDRGALFVALAESLEKRIDALRRGGAATVVAAFDARDALVGRSITVDGQPAVAMGISADGALRIRRPDGTEASCMAGEIRI